MENSKKIKGLKETIRDKSRRILEIDKQIEKMLVLTSVIPEELNKERNNLIDTLTNI